jgi:hypothetical protein
VGSDRVLIGAPKDDAGATDAGAAYLFSTSGILLTTFTNPAPATNVCFGHSVAGVGTERVLIGAYLDDTGATNAGAAYLFGTDGTLLSTLTNPTPNLDDYFGWAVAAVGGDRVLISAHQDDTGAIDSGAAYLFSIPTAGAPSLTIRYTATNTVAIIWASPSAGWNLQQNTNNVSSLNWSNVTSEIQDDGTNKTCIVNPPAGTRFYRLHKP